MSAAIESIVFSGDGGKLTLEVSDYERPTASDVYDANWLKTTVSIAAGPFSGSFRANLTTYEFARLHGQLAEAVKRLSGRVDFESTESDILLAVEFSHRGTATVSGLLRPNGSERTTLSFNFETDQSILSETVRQLDELVVHLPVREAQ
jgi:hypothetical protein